MPPPFLPPFPPPGRPRPKPEPPKPKPPKPKPASKVRARIIGEHSLTPKDENGRTPLPAALVSRGHRCRFRQYAITAGIKGTAVLQGVLSIGPHLPMRTRHEQATTHGGRFRSRYESQAAAQRLRRHRAQNQRRGSVEQADACTTTTASNSLTFISKGEPGRAPSLVSS